MHFMVVNTHRMYVRCDMWLPKSIYERLPEYWLILGLLFMASGVFLGFGYWLAQVYFAVGFGCSAWSAWTLWLRTRSRQTPVQATGTTAPANHSRDDERKDPMPDV
jgi:hypothetical protein